MAFDQGFEVVGCGGEEVEGGGEIVWGVVVDAFDAETFADDLVKSRTTWAELGWGLSAAPK